MKIIIRKKKNLYALSLLFSIIILVDIVAGGIIWIILENGVNSFDYLLIIGLLFFLPLLFNLYLINYIFWQIRGYEIVELTEKILSIERKGKLFKDSSSIPVNKIEKIKEQKYDPTSGSPFWTHPFEFSKVIGEEGGRIRVIYNAKIIGYSFKIASDFGQGLSKEEAHLYVQQMNKILSGQQ